MKRIVLDLRDKYPEIIDLQIYLLAQTSLYHWETKKCFITTGAKRRRRRIQILLLF